MIKLFPGGVGRVVIRNPAHVRTKTVGFPGWDWDTTAGGVAGTVRLYWFTGAGQFRRYSYFVGGDWDYQLAMVENLIGTGSGSPRRCWLFNERIQQRLVDVELL